MTMDLPKVGEIYQHFKRRMYTIVRIAQHSETLEWFVVYESLDDDRVWIRPLHMFCEDIEKDGKKVQRFTRIQTHLSKKNQK